MSFSASRTLARVSLTAWLVVSIEAPLLLLPHEAYIAPPAGFATMLLGDVQRPPLSVCVRVCVVVLIRANDPVPDADTYACVPLGVNAIPRGAAIEAIVLVTLNEERSMTLMLLLAEFDTYANAPFGETATPQGWDPTGIVAITRGPVAALAETEATPLRRATALMTDRAAGIRVCRSTA